ncbi:unnamed protein product [Brassica napus]|uniref:(rape) hypothetical protein n=1 Tax=Brassica napus TaxID=3708 RepID=A0A816REP3_BRANA|nr:unnamed protein product [Brassica napus]
MVKMKLARLILGWSSRVHIHVGGPTKNHLSNHLNVRCRWKLWLQVTVGRNEEWSDNIGCLFGAFIGGRHVMVTGERRVHRSTQNEKQREAVSLSS